MTALEKHIINFIEDKFSFPYLYYDKTEQTWSNEFFLFDIKTGVMYVSDEAKSILGKKYGEPFMTNIMLKVVNAWFNRTYKLTIKEIIKDIPVFDNKPPGKEIIVSIKSSSIRCFIKRSSCMPLKRNPCGNSAINFPSFVNEWIPFSIKKCSIVSKLVSIFPF